MPTLECKGWESRIRAASWILGIVTSGIMAYTSRFFINGDAIAHIEIGEAFRRGDWSGAAMYAHLRRT